MVVRPAEKQLRQAVRAVGTSVAVVRARIRSLLESLNRARGASFHSPRSDHPDPPSVLVPARVDEGDPAVVAHRGLVPVSRGVADHDAVRVLRSFTKSSRSARCVLRPVTPPTPMA